MGFYFRFVAYCCVFCVSPPLLFYPISIASPPQDISTPCSPSPCGANAVCREQNGAGSCTCIDDYQGNPYEGCRPECVINTDCPSDRACIRGKCLDPCPGTCGPSASCQVVSHLPSCTCFPGFTGDPFRYCSPIPPQRKTIIYFSVSGLFEKKHSHFFINKVIKIH